MDDTVNEVIIQAKKFNPYKIQYLKMILKTLSFIF